MKLVWIDAPKALVARDYIMLGWVAVAAFPAMLERLGVTATTLVAVGGLLYTLGALVYAFQRPDPAPTRLRLPRGLPRAGDPRRGAAVRRDRVLRDPGLLSAPGPSLGSSEMDELDALGAFLVAALIAFAATPPVARLARRLGVMHHPRDRDLHDRPVPGLGGLAILAAVVVAALIFLPWNAETRGIVGGALAIAFVGGGRRLASERAAPGGQARGPVRRGGDPGGVRGVGRSVTLPFVDPLDLNDWGKALTLVGIVAVMNVVNFTDGADGLAAGVCTIAAGTFAIIALSLDRPFAGILAALTAGAAVGFLWHNFHPASIFMGDAGSNLLGLLLACVAIEGVLKTAAVVALFFPLLILAVPALDATFVVAKRIKYRPAGLLGRPLALPPPLREHRLLPAAHGALPVRLDAVAGGAGTGDAVRAVLGGRRHPQRRLGARDRGVRAGRPRRERLPGARARDPEVPAASASARSSARSRPARCPR